MPFISPDAAQNWAKRDKTLPGAPLRAATNSFDELKSRAKPGDTGAQVPSSPRSDKSLLDWETLVGGRLALWIGALCLFLALASLLVYVGQTLPPPTPQVRVASGFAASFALFIGAFWARNRTQRWFVDGFLGAGLAVGFLSVWGGGPHFALWSLPVSIGGFSALSAAGVALSARRNSQSLLLLSATGGFLTPLLVRQNHDQMALVFLSYLLLLNSGIVAVCVQKKWREIIYGAFTATVLLACGWASDTHIEALRPLLWAFATLGWVVFGGASCVRALWLREDTEAEDSMLLFSATGLYAATSHWLLAPLLKSFPGAFTLGLALVCALLWAFTRRRVPLNGALRTNFLALSCAAGALFVPLQFGQSGLVWGWMTQAVALCLVGRKSNARLLQNAGKVVWTFALVALASGAIFSNTSAPLDSFSLKLLLCLGATAVLLFDSQEKEDITPVYAAFLAWGGASWIGRASWLGVSLSPQFVPAHRGEAALLLGASAISLWSLLMWRVGWWRRQNELRVNAHLVVGAALCTVAGVAIYGQAPLLAPRIVAFLVGAAAIWLMSANREDESNTRHETPTLAAASWLLFGLTIEIAAHPNDGHFDVPASGAPVWFGLCASWSVFAALIGALSVWRAWPKGWTLAETVFAVATGVLLLQSLLVLNAITPFWNARLGAFAVAWFVALLARQLDCDKNRRGDWWLGALLLLPLWAATQESWNWVATNHVQFGQQWQRFASLGVSLGWSCYAAACLIGGVVRRSQGVRVGGLALGALTVCKVFLLDLSFLDGGLRVLSLGGLGVALMFISWLYGRFGRTERNRAA